MPKIAALFSIFITVIAGIIMAGVTEWAIIAGVVFAFGGVAIGIKGWTDPVFSKSVTGWIGAAAIFLGAGATAFAVECFVGRYFYPDRAFIDAGFHTGIFGGFFTVAVTGSLVLFAIGGAAYRGMEKWMQRKPKEMR